MTATEAAPANPLHHEVALRAVDTWIAHHGPGLKSEGETGKSVAKVYKATIAELLNVTAEPDPFL